MQPGALARLGVHGLTLPAGAAAKEKPMRALPRRVVVMNDVPEDQVTRLAIRAIRVARAGTLQEKDQPVGTLDQDMNVHHVAIERGGVCAGAA
jgi:hypothetical protein